MSVVQRYATPLRSASLATPHHHRFQHYFIGLYTDHIAPTKTSSLHLFLTRISQWYLDGIATATHKKRYLSKN